MRVAQMIESSTGEHKNAGTALNILIPAAGLGSRFMAEGYRFPKPIVNLVGQSMISVLIRNLRLLKEDTILIAVSENQNEKYLIESSLRNELPDLDLQFVKLPHVTSGASETLHAMVQCLPEELLKRRAVAIDFNTFYTADVLDMLRKLPDGTGASFYSIVDPPQPNFSYIETTGPLDLITGITEKRAISNKANVGIYLFPDTRVLWSAVERLLNSRMDKQAIHAEESYVSLAVKNLLEHEMCQFRGLELASKDFHYVGTPQQLRLCLDRMLTSQSTIEMTAKRIAFELEGTLFFPDTKTFDYLKYQPVHRNLDLARELIAAGHYISIHATQHEGRDRESSLMQVRCLLSVFNINCSAVRLITEPYDLIISSKVVHAHVDTRREIGLPELSKPTNELAEVEYARQNGIVPSRDFNTIMIKDAMVSKSSRSSAICGEIFFYTYLPQEVRNYFPRVHGIDFTEESGVFSINMEKAEGVPYSYLLISRGLTRGRLISMLEQLHQIHLTKACKSSKIDMSRSLQTLMKASNGQKADIYANYYGKLRARFAYYWAVYNSISLTKTSKILTDLVNYLVEYQTENRGIGAEVIHGDPNLSNIILDMKSAKITFLDPRGKLGDDVLTTSGDQAYDLAKVLQSLYGYDFIILTSERDIKGKSLETLISAQDQGMLRRLRSTFWTWIADTYGDRMNKKDVMMITASLFFSLIPLHRPAYHGIFLALCEQVLQDATE